jgi:PAS domain S-box-containing protein
MSGDVQPATLRNRAPGALLAGAVLALLLVLLGFQLWLSYANRVATAEVSARNFASIFEARFEATLRRTDADLRALTMEIPLAALRTGGGRRHAPGVEASLRARLFNLQEAVSYRVHDARGEQLYSSDRPGSPRVDLAEHACFRALRDDAQAGLVFCEAVSSVPLGRQMVAVARALRDEHGRFFGVVHGLIELEYYRRQFQSLDLGSAGYIALRRSADDALVMRWPEPVGGPGESSRAAGRRIVGVQFMASYPFYLEVGLARDEVLAGWRKQALAVGITTLLLLALFGALLLRLWRMRARETAMLATLTRSEAQFRMLADMVPVGIAHIDASGSYTYVNERYLEVTGRRSDELLGRSWLSLFPLGERAEIERAWRERADRRGAFVWEYRFVRRDGRLVDVLGEARTETDANGKVRGYLVAQTDITPRKEAEAELLAAKQQAERANQVKTRFLAAASHDLRQPIQAINLFRDALARTDLSEEQKRITNLLAISVHTLGEMLYALLDISKLDAGRLTPELRPVAIDEVFDAIDADFSPLALSKGLRFKLCYPARGMQLTTDLGILLSALRNLIGNAFKYTERGGVLVGVRRRSGRVLVQVFDTGIGIAADYGERLFDECFQVNSDGRDRSKGMGLGLSIARRMAQLLGGEVSFRSRPGVGSAFTLTLPLATPGADAPGGLAPRSAERGETGVETGSDARVVRLRGLRVVVVEDDPLVAQSIGLALRRLALDVTVFTSAEQALASPMLTAADFLLSDFTLPGLDGLQLLEIAARRCQPPPRAALMTGETSPEVLARLCASPWRVLVKPVGLSSLLDALVGET